MRTWIRDPLAILAPNAPRGLVVEEDLIVELVDTAGPKSPCDATFDASRHVIIPGLINTHHHFFQTLTRAHPAAINKPLFPWLQALYPIWGAKLDRDNFRLGVRLALTELLMSGCTTASDHLYAFTHDMADAVDIEVEEASQLGIRIAIARGAINMRSPGDLLADERLMQDHDVVIADCERVLAKYHNPALGSACTVALAPCAPFNVTRELMADTAQLAAQYNCRLHTHLGETIDENEYCLHHYGCRPLDYIEQLGWLTDRVWVAHGIHFSDDEVDRLGRHRVGVCHCPTSNTVLASGICRTKELEAAGAIVGLGVDGSASNDSSNMMEAVRHAMMIGRLRYDAPRSRTLTRYAGRPKAPRTASGAATSARLRQATRLISLSSILTNCAFRAPEIRLPRWCCAVPIAPSASWSAVPGELSTAPHRGWILHSFATNTAQPPDAF
jgi:8-oxoguanine deaminase